MATLTGIQAHAQRLVQLATPPALLRVDSFWHRWRTAHAALEPDVEWLGKAGWTLPMWLQPHAAHELRHRTGDLDRAFLRYYERNRGEKLHALLGELERSPGLRPWRRLLREAVAAFGERRYSIVIPALLITIEGAVSRATRQLRKDRTDVKGAASRKSQNTRLPMRRLVWISIHAFLQVVFGKSRFSGKRPQIVNRHWVAHGRGTGRWSKRECVRLFHALHTIAVTVDRPR